MPFLDHNFLLHTSAARRLYQKYAAPQPILDYHCHLPSAEIAENRHFANLTEIWLEGDHYKWRAMRANGVPERYCTGDASPYEKFLAWGATVPRTLRNPLYEWTHLELRRCFGIEELLDEKSAPAIWARANEILATNELTARGILARFRVAAVCTTDDPANDLAAHKEIAAAKLDTRVYPTFRPDRALDVHRPDIFNPWTDRLGAASNTDIRRFPDFLDTLRKRHREFHEIGGRLSDHGLDHCYTDFCSEKTAAGIFEKSRSGHAATPEERGQFASFLMLFFGHLDAEAGWTKQLHLGARRNVNSRARDTWGTDCGFDSMGDWPQIETLGAYLDRLNSENALPKTILYNVNPHDNYAFATMAGNFQDDSIAGKIQFGSAWWFLDQRQGIEWQLSALSNCGLLSHFVGMTTDSRSFLSYPRHEYFRRVLCNVVGQEIERGELPEPEDMIGPMIEDICFGNAKRYFGLELGAAAK
ncbi:MAG TPA: glucuronate isomerase [Candidatus Acidoferrales bacterium]|nr:glucuronate isomerase [Candidatus Acidoferrales bacterium]